MKTAGYTEPCHSSAIGRERTFLISLLLAFEDFETIVEAEDYHRYGPSSRQVCGASGAMEVNDEKHVTYLFKTSAGSCAGAVSCSLLDTKSSANKS